MVSGATCTLLATQGQMKTEMQMKGNLGRGVLLNSPRTDAQDHGYTKHSEKVPSKGQM